MWLPAVAAVVTAPFYVGFLLVDDLNLAIVLWLMLVFVGTFYLAPTFALVQGLAPPAVGPINSATPC